MEGHLQELRASGIADDLIALNFISLDGAECQDRFFSHLGREYRTNTGVLKRRWLKTYSHLEHGGLWSNGVDPQTDEPSDFGQLKPNKPRLKEEKGFGSDKKPKPLKYESPPKMSIEPMFLAVSVQIWQKYAEQVGAVMPENICVTSEGRAIGFWSWIIDNNLPIVITEGAKKAACLLSNGFAAISLPGIYGGYRQPKDMWGNKSGKPYLHPLLHLFATENRQITFCFDNDSKPKTIAAVQTAIAITGKLLSKLNAMVYVVGWGGAEKGVDDFIVAKGIEAFDSAMEERIPLSKFNFLRLFDLSKYDPTKISTEYLSPEDLEAPEDTQLIGIQSAKGSNKTGALAMLLGKEILEGRRVVIIGHRVQLVQHLCDRFGINSVYEIKGSVDGDILGYGLCVDSLHEKSSVGFCAEDWQGATVVIDEAEQVLWHTLNSKTCQSNRVKILNTFKNLLRTVVGSGGKIYAADADLSTISLDWIVNMIDMPQMKTHVVVNEFKSRHNRLLHVYRDRDPASLFVALKKAVRQGQKLLLHVSAQKVKSKWGSQNVEKLLGKFFPSIKILRIDSETVGDPQHPAMACIRHLDTVMSDYDVVIASPVIETGVSIELRGHFDSVWAIAQGQQTVESVSQTLGRVRADIPRHIWMPEKAPGYNRIGNGATTHYHLMASTSKIAKKNIELLEKADSQEDEWTSWDGWNEKVTYSKCSLEAWSKRACLINASIGRYREAVIEKLLDEGYVLVEQDIPEPETEAATRLAQEVEAIVQQAKESAIEAYKEQNEAIAEIEAPSDVEFARLNKKRSRTKTERLKVRKGELVRRYGGAEVTSELVEKDDKGWHGQLKLHFYLTIGSHLLTARDRKKVSALQGEDGGIFAPDINRQCLSVAIAAFQLLGVERFLNPEAEFTKASLQEWYESLVVPTRWDIKATTGVTINPETDSGISVAQRLLKKLGLKLTKVAHRRTDDGKRERVYKFIPVVDGRQEIFESWLKQAEVENGTEDVAA